MLSLKANQLSYLNNKKAATSGFLLFYFTLRIEKDVDNRIVW